MILVTGATGQIGGELVRLLKGNGASFRAFVRDAERARATLGEGVDLVEGDFSNSPSVERALRGVDTLFLLSSNPALEMGAVAAAKRLGVRRVVKSSAIGFKDQPPSGHGTVEDHIRRSGIKFTLLRPNAFMQTLTAYLPKLINQDGSFALPAGDGRTAWVDTRDIAAVAAAVLQHDGHEHDGVVYAVTGPEALSMGDVATTLTQLLGTPIRYRATSPDEARRYMRTRGLEQMAGFLVEHYGAVERGGFERVSDTVVRLTGVQPRSFTAFAAERREVWRST